MQVVHKDHCQDRYLGLVRFGRATNCFRYVTIAVAVALLFIVSSGASLTIGNHLVNLLHNRLELQNVVQGQQIADSAKRIVSKFQVSQTRTLITMSTLQQ